ncbi:hypothetical protein, partial [Arachnia propionica]|uniref:hypothetical protein n=1 Tax=Arachnia propionica TaxID=1750 RepID=UPI003C6F4537
QPGSTSFTPDHPTPAFPSSASLPDGNASPTVKRQRYSASTRPQGKRDQPRDRGFDSDRSFLAARLNQLWRARLPRHIRADSINSMENGHKNRGFCPPFGHFLKLTLPQPRHRPSFPSPFNFRHAREHAAQEQQKCL